MFANPIIVFAACLLLPLIVFSLYIYSTQGLSKVDYKSLNLIVDNRVWFEVNYQVKEDLIEFDGWATFRGVSNNRYNWETPSYNTQYGVYSNNQLVLKDSEGNLFSTKTYSVPNNSISLLLDDLRNHDNDGFIARIRKSTLKKGETYQIGVLLTKLDGTQILIFSDKYLGI
jgi:hypothetical protein